MIKFEKHVVNHVDLSHGYSLETNIYLRFLLQKFENEELEMEELENEELEMEELEMEEF